ncbi:RNA polymerase sigma factor [Acidicapsa dinghuensis]|uniref:RNA polymerase sigma factor n=1 Tax=Acidicapsa dinghuensis TaxID=2218256 RepID=A0ABW1E9F8_9BACT|nr:sigma factor-like helix-turn-helix DNA-binding protein [Acidicapsa dinghuensis]
MSAALQFPFLPARHSGPIGPVGPIAFTTSLQASAQPGNLQRGAAPQSKPAEVESSKPLASGPHTSWAFYRKHTESLLRRYLYASMQVGRAPNILGDPVGRGWVSSRRIRTFEDALIFVLDVERCLNRLSPLDRKLISRILLQEYTHAETASLVGISVRSVCNKLPDAIDRLTELLVNAELLVITS